MGSGPFFWRIAKRMIWIQLNFTLLNFFFCFYALFTLLFCCTLHQCCALLVLIALFWREPKNVSEVLAEKPFLLKLQLLLEKSYHVVNIP